MDDDRATRKTSSSPPPSKPFFITRILGLNSKFTVALLSALLLASLRAGPRLAKLLSPPTQSGEACLHNPM